ncbi:MAG: polysaccharide deacetylase family protein [Gemmatimonadetes bacterium]|nr:polysaccharide deacetylase family protein [Gemmatimonadota bacterium]
MAPTRRVAVTFDDLPANSFLGTTAAFASVTDSLLEGLVRNEIPAIGFVNETKLYVEGVLQPARTAFLRGWLEAGLELGNHSFSHPDISTTPLDEYQADVLAGEEVTGRLMAETGAAPRYFRHPFLRTGTDIETKRAFEAFLAEHGYEVAPVTIDNQEWIYARAYDHAQVRDDAELAARIAVSYLTYMDSVFGYYEAQSRALLGYELPQVLLLHANQLNADVIDPLADMMRDRGYAFVPLEVALEDPAYDSPDEYVGWGGITWPHRWALTAGERGDFFAGEPEAPEFVQEVFRDPPPRPPGPGPR